MNAELLSVGTELLLGEILNTDAKFLAEELSVLGINVYYQTVVGDNKERLKNALELALSRADLVIASGGLGPTPDDLTKEVIAETMGEGLVLDEESFDRIKKYFNKVQREMPQSNIKQAMMPENCIILKNNNGTAPGCIIEKNSKIVVMLPGPPHELVAMFNESVKPYLMEKSEGMLYSETLKLFGIGESKAAEILQDMMESKNPTLAPYAETAGLRLRLTAFAKNKKEGEMLLKEAKTKIYEKLGEYIYAEGDATLPETVTKMLIDKKITISAAESCTGGMFTKMIVDISGSSEILSESIVTYANSAKEKYLGVEHETLEKYGAVSEETARQMAEGIRKAANSDIGVGITGIAGPGGGTKEKPVGLVYVGVSCKEETVVKKLTLSGNREKVRYSAALNAFDIVYKILKRF